MPNSLHASDIESLLSIFRRALPVSSPYNEKLDEIYVNRLADDKHHDPVIRLHNLIRAE